MREIEFDENHPLDKAQLFKQLFDDEHDPRSKSYQRVLIRPRINWAAAALFLAGLALIVAALPIALSRLGLNKAWVWALVCALALIYLALCAKKLAIGMVRIYQRFAPSSLRNRCRFEPSCSQYMILAIQKYGLIKGARKGLDRVRRCNVHGGGFDEP